MTLVEYSEMVVRCGREVEGVENADDDINEQNTDNSNTESTDVL